ncbi:phosphopantetheine adenylyltransferase [Mycoplasma mycoides subsp. mycoides]|uniref:pantetheine-phosphate adenylyltransferase n=1 Tax=Mycoplasma mycoides TaxID=2102 RepID=UPI000767E359|nr:pantetheine-phosphate adenylyltransferase [Mycoplasma mycoides]AME10479.1 phosphopantetheine adenylyltransferase [Mycoplasma mycoides subsp. mycoides]AME11487.1 phosphopantetheine adenylyltransferase [Mycoplasma mycoides subsp. mycoides]AME12510.1 phosphopantetheine adenylyltransferase [Mycoplasma mycoides subsp. mycoides]AME13545.1 phosphopantetheine adenylyltransferase [Mycoplasma mycoides subsp. mycoides]AME14536.1 phosphopantetheine adenylyltransferase [Mycoplasma mycoides subsp. mycoid
MKTAIYPGSFNPFHNGHLNILKKAILLFDKVYVVVSKNINKSLDPDLQSRVKNIKNLIRDFNNVEIIINENKLTTTIAKELNASFIIRGLRSQADFEYEIKYYDGFKSLYPNIEVIYFISDYDKRSLSSTILREIEFYKK